MTDDELFERLRREIAGGWIPIPDERGWRGSDAPGKLLRTRLGFTGGRPDLPNAGTWHMRFFGGGGPGGLVTLFGSMGEPEGYLEPLLLHFGRTRGDRVSFIHTIRGQSDKGFRVVNDGTRVSLRNEDAPYLTLPSWTHASLKQAFARKYGRLIVVQGQVRTAPREVSYERADVYFEPRTDDVPAMVADGRIAVEFNVKTAGADGLRDHGPRFRVRFGDLPDLYDRHIPL